MIALAPHTCALCIEPIRGLVHHEMIDGRGPYALGSCCHTPIEAVRAEDRGRGRPRRDTAQDKTADMRAYRAQLAAEGVCYNGRSHGPRTHGVFCLKCAVRSKANSAARSAAYRARRSTNSLP